MNNDLRALMYDYLATHPEGGTQQILADALADAGHDREATMMRQTGGLEATMAAVCCLPLKVGRKSLRSWLTGEIKVATTDLFVARRDRRENPDGDFDTHGRWYPSDAEDCGDFRSVRSPSKAWPYSYMLRARTKEHCRMLIEAHVAGFEVPKEAAARGAAIRQKLLAILSGDADR